MPSLKTTSEQLRGLDALVIDLQDVGSRYYTFVSTMFFCLEAAAENKLLVIVLDRPNPIGGEAVEGPILQPRFASYVGLEPVCTRHGMTIGELALWYRKRHGLNVNLQVIACEGLRREMYFEDTGLPWVLPSPNMPTVDTAVVYPGQCLIEGTNLSEGREARLATFGDARRGSTYQRKRRMRDEDRQGPVQPVWYRPTFQIRQQNCAASDSLDRAAFQPVALVSPLLYDARRVQQRFDWRRGV